MNTRANQNDWTAQGCLISEKHYRSDPMVPEPIGATRRANIDAMGTRETHSQHNLSLGNVTASPQGANHSFLRSVTAKSGFARL